MLPKPRTGFVLLLALVLAPAPLLAGDGALAWIWRHEPALMDHLGTLLEFAPDAAPAAGPRLGGVLVAELPDEGARAWIVVADHLCSSSACEVVILAGADTMPDGIVEALPSRLLYRATSFGLPALAGRDAQGRPRLVLQALGDGPTCCAPRLPVLHGIGPDGQWAELGPATGEWPVLWARDLGIERGG